jgi:hypothetical protein
MRCIELKICLVLHQNPASNFGTTYFLFFTKSNFYIMNLTNFLTRLRVFLPFVTLFACFTILFSHCVSPETVCPDKTCSDLNLVARATFNADSTRVVHDLRFQPIDNGSYRVEARDSISNHILYSSGTTASTNTSYLFTTNYFPRTVKWTVTATYCGDIKTLTCNSFARVKSGGIGVVVVERRYKCPNGNNDGIQLNDFYNNFSATANPLPSDILFYKNNMSETKANFMDLIENKYLLFNTDKMEDTDCNDSFGEDYIQFEDRVGYIGTATNVTDLEMNIYIHNALSDTYGAAYGTDPAIYTNHYFRMLTYP